MENEQLSREEAIRRIEQLGGTYDPDSHLPLLDQLLICETLVDSTPVDLTDIDGSTILSLRNGNGVNANAYEDDNGSYKRRVNFELTDSKLRAIAKINDFTHPLNPLEMESCLTEIFSEYPCTEGWWLHVGQRWTQRVIHWVLNYVLKLQETGRITKDPASCFTYFIQHRKKRAFFRSTNDTR